MPELVLKSKDIKQFARFLNSNPNLVKKHTSVAMKKSIFSLEATSKKESPVDTGRMRGSIQSTITPLESTITPMTDYAIFVHEGTRYQKANPFLTRAMNKDKSKVIGFFSKALDKIITALKNG